MSKQCPICFNVNDDDSAFCISCGSPFPLGSPQNNNNRSNTKLITVIIVVVTVILLLIAAIVTFVLLDNNSEKKSENGDGSESTFVFYENTTEAKKEVDVNLEVDEDDKDNFDETTKKVTEQSRQAAVDKVEPDANKTITFDQYEMNLLLSNITEVGFPQFKGMPSSEDIEMLAVRHSVLNPNKSVSGYESGNWTVNGNNCNFRIKSSYVNELSNRFFGIDYAPSAQGSAHTDGGYFYAWITSSDLKSFGFAVVNSAEKNSDGTINVSFDIYTAKNGDESKYYKYSPEQAAADSALQYVSFGTATLKNHTYNGKSTYKIVSYYAF